MNQEAYNASTGDITIVPGLSYSINDKNKNSRNKMRMRITEIHRKLTTR